MILFLVRHASGENSSNLWQSPDSKISKLGKEQALILSKKSRFSQIDKIFSSKWVRSKETAEIIAKNLKLKVKILDYIHEREQSTLIYGASRQSKISLEYLKEYRNNFKNLDWKFKKGEESLRDVLGRASKFSTLLINEYKENRVLVVSHDVFIRCFIALVLLGSNYSDEAMMRVINSLTIANSGITMLIYDGKRKLWKIGYVNDFSHLKNIKRRSN